MSIVTARLGSIQLPLTVRRRFQQTDTYYPCRQAYNVV